MAFSQRTMRAEDWAGLAPEFSRSEFNYPDLMGFEFLQWLRALRQRLGFPLYPTSDHRPPDRNAAAGGASRSAHMDVPCEAVDIGRNKRTGVGLTSAQRFELVRAAMEMGCRRIGVYENGSVHLDMAMGGRPQGVLWVTF